ncbi:hypothetical protein [Roseovarius aestuariivivens]|uniref:hypothetical protein n=1 Tax=Roseovarius aestuariivivens TaxID=1888910 RepID=UPI0010813D11|nr:hypothetical protein [Roseovarius aestuariivivens]
MTVQTGISRPELTLPDAEAARLRAAYRDARVILEYGSGGSTVLAAEMPGKTIYAVESDRDWAEMMLGWFELNPPATGSDAQIIWVDIGPTKEWGHPRKASKHLQFARYPLAVWDMEGLQQPDVVLVDGRFRAGCVMAAAFRTAKPVTVFVDDYKQRKAYHRVEEFVGPPTMTGRLAEFRVAPMLPDPARLLDIVEMMTRP